MKATSRRIRRGDPGLWPRNHLSVSEKSKWRGSISRKSAAAAQHLLAVTSDESALAARCAANAVATAEWAVDRANFKEHEEQLKGWASSLETAIQTHSAEWIDRLSAAARHYEQQQCARSRSRQHTAWKQHFRHGGSRLANGYAPTRRAFQYVRGPMGWTQAPVAPAAQKAAEEVSIGGWTIGAVDTGRVVLKRPTWQLDGAR